MENIEYINYRNPFWINFALYSTYSIVIHTFHSSLSSSLASFTQSKIDNYFLVIFHSIKSPINAGRHNSICQSARSLGLWPKKSAELSAPSFRIAFWWARERECRWGRVCVERETECFLIDFKNKFQARRKHVWQALVERRGRGAMRAPAFG